MPDFDEVPDEVKYPDRYAHFERVYSRRSGKTADAVQYVNEWHNKGYTGEYVTDVFDDDGGDYDHPHDPIECGCELTQEDAPRAATEAEAWERLRELQDKVNAAKARQESLTLDADRWKEELPPRADLLDEAKRLITGDRNNTYGPPTQDFQRAADAMTAMGYRSVSGPIRAHDVAVLVSLVKISRLQWSPGKRDHWADLAGYAACGYECTIDEEDR